MIKTKEDNMLPPTTNLLEQNEDYDPYLETCSSVEQKPKVDPLLANIPILSQPIIKSSSIKPQPQKFDFGYQIILTNPHEDGLMETFLNEAITDDKPRSDPSDWFNFGLDEDKWRKILNHNILMHYEKHLMSETQPKNDIQQQINSYNNTTNNNTINNNNMTQPNQMAMKQNMYSLQQMHMQMQMRGGYQGQMPNFMPNQMYQQRPMFPMMNPMMQTTQPSLIPSSPNATTIEDKTK